jgi:DNA (cytosine-5)-methyltransferase 1
MDFSPRKKKYLAMVPPGSNWRSLPPDIQRESMGKVLQAKGGRSGWWRRLTFDLPCPTLVTMPNHAGTSLCHPTESRALSIREYQLIQEFPENWELCGTIAQQYAQIGNAVPVRLGEVAGMVVVAGLDALKARGWHAYPGNTARYRVIYVQSHVRTRQWFKDGQTLIWQDGQTNGHAEYGKPKTLRTTRSLA